jgi:tRNA-binding protein
VASDEGSRRRNGGYLRLKFGPDVSTRRIHGYNLPALNAQLPEKPMTPYEAFTLLDMRLGRILRVELNERARKPAYKLWVDFGELGTKTSSAQLVDLYKPEELLGRLVVAAVNLGARNIAGFASEVLVLGAPDPNGHVVLLAPEREVPLGGRVF